MARVPLRLIFLAAGAAAAWLWYKGSQDDREPPAPQPSPEPEPEPADEVAPEPADPPAPEPVKPEPVEVPGLIEVRGILVPDPDALLAFANTADAEALAHAGVNNAARKRILQLRPFGSVDGLASTRGIGPKTLQALVDAS